MFAYPVGYRSFHPNDILNYQVNRWLPTADEAEFTEAAQVTSLPAWEKAMLGLADRAAAQERPLHAATYLRAAEFFMGFERPEKNATYARYKEQVERIDLGAPFERVQVPFRDGHLPSYLFRARGPRRDTLVVHGGFDSYVEEFVFWGAEFAELGYDVVLFEGPGQGACIRELGMTMDPEWERPVRAILDHFQIGGCTLLGLSLGGYLALRAAAFEPRVERVMALDVMFDFFECVARRLGPNACTMLSRRLAAGDDVALDHAFQQLSSSNPGVAWALAHGRHISGATSTTDYLRWLKRLGTASFSARVEQDVLLLAGAEDHIVPVGQLLQQQAALVNARSVTTRLFTAREDAQAHCQVGNIRLALDCMQTWLDFQLRQIHR